MNLPPSDFAATFRALVMPKLRGMIEVQGLYLAHDLATFREAHAVIMDEAARRGATYLPPEHLDAFIDWTQTALLAAADRAEARATNV